MSNEDGSVWIIFNGEIYNHSQLRPLLQEQGHHYATNSDTETILHLYEEYGEDCVHRLQGMFSFAIWDMGRHRLFCARDRLGIKPFYYSILPQYFAFASEIKALLEAPSFARRLNRSVLPEFLAFGYISSSDTLFEGIYKLLPGHRLIIDLRAKDCQPQITQYWDLDCPSLEAIRDEAEYVNQFDNMFRNTVSMHLMSDVPLGVFLSGGLDSSSIAAVATEVRKAPIQTFSVGYKEDRYSELSLARRVAKHIGAIHSEIILSADDFFKSLGKLTWHEDEPLVWPSSVALYYAARLAAQKVKVVLTGEGADEILAGYLKYRATLWNLSAAPIYKKVVPESLQRVARAIPEMEGVPDWIRRKVRHSFLYYSDDIEHMHLDNFYSTFSEQQQPKLLSPELWDELRDINAYANTMQHFRTEQSGGDLLNRLLYLDMKTYLVELLMKQDQMSMAASVESRVPFLDHKLVECVNRLPARYKVRGLSGKYLLRKAMASRLPSEVIKGHKRGFPTPVRPWLQNQLFDKVSNILTDGRMAERRLFRSEHLDAVLKAHRAGFSNATDCCWRLLTLELWQRIFLDRDSKALDSHTPHCEAAMCAA